MSQEELAYAGNYNTQVDFLVTNSISKKPVLAFLFDATGVSQGNRKAI